MNEIMITEEKTIEEHINEKTRQLLTFHLGENIYGVPITQVIEVLEYQKITRIPRAPSYMKGIINVRGSVQPVMDIRERFGLGETEKTETTGIIIMELEINGEISQVGILTDAVREVISLKESDIEPAPRSKRTGGAYTEAVGKTDEGFVIILAVQRVFEDDEFLSSGDPR